MRTFLIGLLVGLIAGAIGGVLGSSHLQTYLPAALGGGEGEAVEGTVVAKRLEGNRLLLTVDTPQGSVLATFRDKMSEIDLLVEEGDSLTLVLPKYEPFVEEAAIERVRKPEVPAEPLEAPEIGEPTGEGDPQTPS
jgi:hypothetical protein